MIRSSAPGKGLALTLALAAHGALTLVLLPQEVVLIEGQAGAAEARLGSSFADMAAGTLSSETPGEIVEAERPVDPLPVTPQETIAANAPPDPIPPRPPAETAPSPAPPVADRPLAVPVEQARAAAPPKAPTEPAEGAKATPPEETTTAEPPEPKRIVAQERPEDGPKPAPRPNRLAQPTPKGNADRTAQAGQAVGRDTAKAATSGQGGSADAAGNAAASNYPGLVMRALARVPRPPIRTRGAAVVAFKVAGNGGLSGASVVRSSGSAALDQAALRLVRRAAPFPPPPRGAQRSFSIRIEGRR